MKQKTYDDDDGRTIADMSGVQRDSMFLPRSLKKHGTFAEKEEEEAAEPQYTNEQRRTAVGGALTAAMLIAGVFIGAGAIVIAILTLIWH
ncbi:MAG: hypothetical protein II621_09375 [Clostridia bacterium]|nr:hypothetical protein [Clostridia bacterium]MBQ4366368.1 hypothetical protein [Clostridia bacterium]